MDDNWARDMAERLRFNAAHSDRPIADMLREAVDRGLFNGREARRIARHAGIGGW